MTDSNFSPWPAPGDHVYFTWRRAAWVSPRLKPGVGQGIVDEFYPQEIANVATVKVRRFWYPFLSVRTSWFSFYLGWKPITLADPGFIWRDLVDLEPGELAVELSLRTARGDAT